LYEFEKIKIINENQNIILNNKINELEKIILNYEDDITKFKCAINENEHLKLK